MKVYTEIIIDMQTLEVESEKSFEYSGPIAHCGGGGGAQGRVDYPDYMKTQHHMWLNGGSAGGVGPAISTYIADGIAHNPHNEHYVYDPSNEISTMWSRAGGLDNPLNCMDVSCQFNDIVSYTKDNWLALITNPDEIDDVIDAFAQKFDEDIEGTVLPRFEAGMRDINAVQTSAFVIGRALIETSRNHDVAVFSGDTRMRARFDGVTNGIKAIHEAYSLELQALAHKLEYTRALSALMVETGRIVIVANKEYADGKIEERDARGKWPLDLYTYGGNMLASIGSASVQTGIKKNKTASAIGGGLSGAAMGASTGAQMGVSGGGYYGAAIGAVLGAAAGLLSSRQEFL